jgi:hypothetical protein
MWHANRSIGKGSLACLFAVAIVPVNSYYRRLSAELPENLRGA